MTAPLAPLVTGPLGELSWAPPWEAVELSPVAAELLGRPGTARLDVATPAYTDAVTGLPAHPALARAVRTGDPTVLTGRVHRPCDGVERTLTGIAVPVRDASGRPALVGRVVDITDAVCGGDDLRVVDRVGVALLGHLAVVVLAGDVDATRRRQLADALGLAVELGAGDVHVDASHLRFCDAPAAAALVGSARGLGARRRLVVHGAPPVLTRLLHVLGDSGHGAGPALVLRERAAAAEPRPAGPRGRA